MPNNQDLAEKIADLLRNESPSSDLQSINAGIEKLNARIEGLERKFTEQEAHESKPKTLVTNHPSLNKYNVVEAIVDEVFANQNTEKTCTFEPNGKPCDSCSMCNSHGF